MNDKSRSMVGFAFLTLSLALSFGVVVTAHAADAPAAPATPQNVPAQKQEQPLQEVVVTGMRANLEKSLEVKKTAPVVLDSIDSTELGRFPDDDVADSLAHLPGITLTRTTGGEGEKVSIRGLTREYNIITLNNRIIASDDDGRDLAFDVLPSEVIAAADVLKSPQASAVEGSIGGTVNLRTASPFSNPGFHVGAHAGTDYNVMSKLHGRKYSAFLENTLAGDTLGFVLGGVHSDVNVRTDSLNAYNQSIYGPMIYPFSANQGDPGSVALAATPCCITFGSIFDDKKRDALSGRLEWQPGSTVKLTADALWTHLNDPQIGYNQSYYFAADPAGDGWTNVAVNKDIISGVTVQGFQPEMVNNTINRKVDTWLYGVNASWKPAERLTIGLDGYRSTASRPEGGADTFVTAGLVTDQPNAVDTLIFTDVPNSLPNINVLVPPSQLGLAACPPGTASTAGPGNCSYTALMNSGFLNNNRYWSTHYVGLNGYSVHDQITGLTLDGAWDSKGGFVNRVLFGIGGTSREKNRVDRSNDWTNGSGQYGSLYLTSGCPIQCNPYSFASQGFNVISTISPPNYMQGAGGAYPTSLPQIDVAQLLAFLQSLDGKLNPQACVPGSQCVPFRFADTLPQVNAFNSYRVTEKTASLYMEAQFGAHQWAGNLGVRVVRTTTTASTASAVPDYLWTPNPNAGTVTYIVHYGAAQPIGADGRYTLALPSLNLSYWALPNRLQLRLALAEVMSRPNLSYLAPTSTNNAINGDPTLSYSGTAGLKPIKASQADLSIEWYYAAHSALTAALFGKKIRNDIYTATSTNVDLGTLKYDGGPPGTVPGVKFLWTISAPANGADDTFTGYELTWQHLRDDGFGARVQFTRTYNKSYDQSGNYIRGAINSAPPTTVSVGLLYDKGPLSADINWDYAASYVSYCSRCTEVPLWQATASPFRWLTSTLHYKFGSGVEVYLEGKNLTNSVARSYLNGNPLLPWAPGQLVGESLSGVGEGYSAYGRTYVLGLAYRF